MRKRKKYQGVTAFVGMPGGGKTYALAEIGTRALARGERVYSNAGFDLQGTEVISTFDEFAALQGPAVVVWDELPLYFNARKWQEFPDAMLYKFTQIRKDGLQLYYSAIHEAMIDTNIRRITFWYYHCRAITGRFLIRKLYPPEEFRRQGQKAMGSDWVWVRDSVARAYDTDRKVAVPQRLREKIRSGASDRETWAPLSVPGNGRVPARQRRGAPPRVPLGDTWSFGGPREGVAGSEGRAAASGGGG